MTGVAVSMADAIGEAIEVGTAAGAEVGTAVEAAVDIGGNDAVGDDVLEGGIVLQLGCLPAAGYCPLPDATLSGAILSAFKIHLVSILIVLYPTNR
jgi:hypothetical protein